MSAEAPSELIRLRPDLIVLGGDYVTWATGGTSNRPPRRCRACQAPHGVFAVLGNHDDDRDMPSALHRHGIEVLRDARTQLRIRNEPLELVGIRYWTKRASDIALAARGAAGTAILLAHDPRRLIEASALNIPARAVGPHARRPGGAAGLRRRRGQEVPRRLGLASLGDTRMFVSRGVGTVYVPIRFDCPPEVALLTLKSPDAT